MPFLIEMMLLILVTILVFNYIIGFVFTGKYKWKDGRQGSEYKVLTLVNSTLFNTDFHIIHYPPNGSIPPHTDPSKEGMTHHRLNIEIWGSGEFKCDSYKKWGCFTYFRPDLYTHSFINGDKDRYVLSIGWLKKI